MVIHESEQSGGAESSSAKTNGSYEEIPAATQQTKSPAWLSKDDRTMEFCPRCMQDVEETQRNCTHCGYCLTCF